MPSRLCIRLWQCKGQKPGLSARKRTIVYPWAGNSKVFFETGRNLSFEAKVKAVSFQKCFVQLGLAHFKFGLISIIFPFVLMTGYPKL